jgi:hypothetical protein
VIELTLTHELGHHVTGLGDVAMALVEEGVL